MEWCVLNSKHFGVPQNRERVFIVGHSGEASRRTVFPIESAAGQNSIAVKQIGHRKGYNCNTKTYDITGISGTLVTAQGGGGEPHIAMPVLTPERTENRQNGRRFKTAGEPMFTLTAQDRHGVLIKDNDNKFIDSTENKPKITDNARTIKARYNAGVTNFSGDNSGVLTREGDSINIGRPTSTTRGGRVGKNIANIITCQSELATLQNMRIRN